MLVFGGKPSKGDDAPTAADEEKEEIARLEAIERLEEKEQALLRELEATRSQLHVSITSSLSPVSGRSVQARALPDLDTLKPGTMKGLPVTSSGHYDLLPVLTRSGEEAFEVGLNATDSVHMLPVFKMPSVEKGAEERIQKRLPTSYNVRNAQVDAHLRATQARDIQEALGIDQKEMHKLETDLFSPQISTYTQPSGRDALDLDKFGGSNYSMMSDEFSFGDVGSFIGKNVVLGEVPTGGKKLIPDAVDLVESRQNVQMQRYRKSVLKRQRNVKGKGVLRSPTGINRRRKQRSFGGRRRKMSSPKSRMQLESKGADVGKLRADLLRSLQAVQDSSSAVEDGILWVRQKCPVTSIRAQMFMKRWGFEKIKHVFAAMENRKVRAGFLCWREATDLAAEKEKQEQFARLSGASRTYQAILSMYYKQLRKSFSKWWDDVREEMLREEIARKVEYACVLQRWVRNAQARKFMRLIREARIRKEQDMAATDIQKWVRGKAARKITGALMEIFYRNRAAGKMQGMYRKWASRKLMRIIFETQKRNRAAKHIQRVARGAAGRRRRDYLILNKHMEAATMLVQRVYRGYLGCKKVARMKRDIHRNQATIVMQRRVRGIQGRKKMMKRRAEHAIYMRKLEQCATRVQAIYRGHRGKLAFMLKQAAMQKRKKLILEKTQVIQRAYRAYKSRSLLGMAKDAKFFKMVVDARAWVEYFDNDAGKLFYFNAQTEEALWEPPPTGYTRQDGRLVLYNGNDIENPTDDTSREEIEAKIKAEKAEKKRLENEGKEVEEEKEEEKLCAECETAIGAGICKECEDIFCESCYYQLHSKGNRVKHTFQPFAGWHGDTTTEDESVAEGEASADATATAEDGYETGYETAEGYETGYEMSEEYAAAGYYDESGNWIAQAEQEKGTAAAGEGGDDGWEEHQDEAGNTYYWNKNTGESSWERPVINKMKTLIKMGMFNADTIKESQFGEDAAQGEWVEYWDEENECSYWWRESDGSSTYENPYK